MTKQAIFKRIALEDGYVTDKSMFAVEDDRDLVYKAMDVYAKQQAIAFGQFRDKFKLLEMARIDKIIQEKGMITYDLAKDEYIYHQFIEHQKQNNQ
jgi:hypothetical protein